MVKPYYFLSGIIIEIFIGLEMWDISKKEMIFLLSFFIRKLGQCTIKILLIDRLPKIQKVKKY